MGKVVKGVTEVGVMGRGIQSCAEKRHLFSSPTVYGSPFYRCVLLLLWVATCHPRVPVYQRENAHNFVSGFVIGTTFAYTEVLYNT